MRSITVIVFACACALASGSYFTKDVKYADKDFLVKQKAVFDVLQHIHQNEVFTKLYEEAKGFKLIDFRDHFKNVQYFDEFVFMFEKGMLPMNEIFALTNRVHVDEVIALFRMFYYANDWETFYKFMVWARFYINEGQFVYALTVAVLHRHDFEGFVLPAIYEIYPYYFFDTETITRAQQYKMQGFYGMKKIENTYNVVIPSNYTGYYTHYNDEQRISYFTEDIGLNAYYYYFHMDYPFWMGGEEFGLVKDRRGEFFFYQHQQLLARYFLERLSNDIGEIPELSFYEPIAAGYYPNLRFYNGEAFPVRENDFIVYHRDNYYRVDRFEDFERRFRDAVDYGFLIMPDNTHVDLTKYESIEILGNLFSGNKDSLFFRYFGSMIFYGRTLLGGSFEHYEHYRNVLPSVMENYSTMLRDPVFYQLYKRVLKYFYQFQDKFGYYKYDELNFKGVKIDGVDVDKLTTYFDKFDADITNVVDVEMFDDKTKMSDFMKFGRISHYQGEDILFKARQYRLNHLPFTFKLKVDSDKVQKAVVKVFIGPKYDAFGHVYNVADNRENFYELDHFLVDLVVGKNEIVRNSEDFSWFVKDRTTFYDLYKQLMLSMTTDAKFPLDMSEAHCGVPMRLMLPKGKKGGMPFQFFFMVVPYYPPTVERFTGYDYKLSCGVGSGARYLDKLPFGYPFNRPIDFKNWFTPNMFYYDVLIFHKQEKEVNSSVQ